MNDREVQTTALEHVSAAPIEVAQGLPARIPRSPWQALHQRLRGRYIWAVLLALLGLGGGGYLGYKSTQPLYAGRGLIYFQPSLFTPTDPTATNVLPMFQGFVALQVDLLKSPRIALLAMNTKQWKKTGQPSGPMEIADFVRRTQILHAGGTQHVRIQFSDPASDVALAGVHALIEAYEKLSADLNDANDKLEYARAQIDILNAQMKSGTDQILAFTAEYGGVEGMEIRHRAAMKQVLDTEEILGNVERLIRDYRAPEEGKASSGSIPAAEIAVENRQMEEALYQLDVLRAEEEYMAEKAGNKNPALAQLRRKIKILEERITKLAAAWNRMNARKKSGGVSKEELEERKASLQEHIEALGKNSRRIGETRAAVERLQAGNEDLQRQLSAMTTMKDELQSKLQGKGRILIPDPGTLPTSYYRDRRVTYGLAAGLLGAVLGVLLVLLIGLRDHRLKDAGGVNHSLQQVRLLGLMPAVPHDLGADDDQQVAAHCIHQIRTFLQIGHARQGGACICVSGPGVSSGKTTLATALGLSFGSSGTRTLLVDADLSGRGLTWRVSQMLLNHARGIVMGTAGVSGADADDGPEDAARKLLERSLVRASAGDWPEAGELCELLEEGIQRLGLEEAKASGVIDDLFALADLLFSGETRDEMASKLMVALGAEGVLTFGSPSQWIPPRILELSSRKPAVNGSPLERYMYRTGVESLRFMPLRGLGRGGAVSAATISQVLDRIRAEFDVAIVDTGPVPGTVETSMVAANADSVVLVVSPEDHRPDAERAVAHMEVVGAKVAGVVFNRAGHRELVRSAMSRSSPRGGVDL